MDVVCVIKTDNSNGIEFLQRAASYTIMSKSVFGILNSPATLSDSF